MLRSVFLALLFAVVVQVNAAQALPLAMVSRTEVVSTGDALVWLEPDGALIIAEADGSVRHSIRPELDCDLGDEGSGGR